MERLRRRSRDEHRPEPLELPLGVSATGPEEVRVEQPGAGESVTVVWGAMSEQLDVGSLTVEEVYRLLRDPFRIAPGVRARVNGKAIEPSHRLAQGDTLEFTRPAGEKGAAA